MFIKLKGLQTMSENVQGTKEWSRVNYAYNLSRTANVSRYEHAR